MFTLKAVGSESTEFIIVDLQLHQRGRESRHFSEVVSIKVQSPELRQVLQQAEKILMKLSKPDWKYFKACCKSTEAEVTQHRYSEFIWHEAQMFLDDATEHR